MVSISWFYWDIEVKIIEQGAKPELQTLHVYERIKTKKLINQITPLFIHSSVKAMYSTSELQVVIQLD